MSLLRTIVVAIMVFFVTALPAAAAEGLVTKASTHSVDETLDRLEAALKERGLIIFARLDHAAAAQSMGLKMPRPTVLVHGQSAGRHASLHPASHPRDRISAQGTGVGGRWR